MLVLGVTVSLGVEVALLRLFALLLNKPWAGLLVAEFKTFPEDIGLPLDRLIVNKLHSKHTD